MSDIKIGDVVKNIAGREKNDIYIVLEVTKDYVYIVDGKKRRLESPKKKNKKHLLLLGIESKIKINKDSKDVNCENSKIRKELRRISTMEVANV